MGLKKFKPRWQASSWQEVTHPEVRQQESRQPEVKQENQKSSAKLPTSQRENFLSCPPYQATWRGCGKWNHFEAVCRSKGKQERRKAWHPVNKVSEEESSDENEAYTFSLSTKTLNDHPFFRIKVHDMPVMIMADSRESIDVLDEKEYHRLTNCPKLELSSVKIYGYRSKVSLLIAQNAATHPGL